MDAFVKKFPTLEKHMEDEDLNICGITLIITEEALEEFKDKTFPALLNECKTAREFRRKFRKAVDILPPNGIDL